MEINERYAQYRICESRGHEPSNVTLTSDPPWSVCKHCGTHYRYDTTLVESGVPRGPNDPVPE